MCVRVSASEWLRDNRRRLVFANQSFGDDGDDDNDADDNIHREVIIFLFSLVCLFGRSGVARVGDNQSRVDSECVSVYTMHGCMDVNGLWWVFLERRGVEEGLFVEFDWIV